jgi:bla regulator protein blaR1
MKTSPVRSIFCPAVLLFAITAPSTIISSQTTTRRPSFEVASIKPNNSVGATTTPPVVAGDYFACRGRTLKTLIAFAYCVRDWQIQGGPGWIDSQRWDVKARAGEKIISATPRPFDPKAPSVMALMLQSLLEDRFQLRIQHQIKESPVYNLVVARGGPKIKLDDDQSPPKPSALNESGIPASLLAPPGSELPRGNIRGTPNSIEARAVSIESFIQLVLFTRSDRPVIDRTNLKGLYSIKMKWSLDDSVPGGPIGFGPAFFTAIKEQLGLRLESAKGPVDFIIITSTRKPSED